MSPDNLSLLTVFEAPSLTIFFCPTSGAHVAAQEDRNEQTNCDSQAASEEFCSDHCQ